MVRKTTMLLILLSVSALFIAGSYAQQQKEMQMEAPKLPDAMKKLDVFVGNWSGTGTMTDMGHSQKVEINHKNTKFAQGWGLEFLEHVTMPESPNMPAYDCVNTMGYDMGGGKYHVYSVSNYGDTHDHIGDWINDKTMFFQYKGMMNGKSFLENLYITVDSPTRYSIVDSVRVGGEVAQVVKGSVQKM